MLEFVANTLLYLLHEATNSACSSAVMGPLTRSSIEIGLDLNSSGCSSKYWAIVLSVRRHVASMLMH